MIDIKSILNEFKEAIIREVKEELREFKASVNGTLEGFKVAIISMEQRISNIENELRAIRAELNETKSYLIQRIDETNKRIDETNKRIDEVRVELTQRVDETNNMIKETNKRIDETNKRIDETNKRIDEVVFEMGKMRAEIREAVVARETLGDIYTRLQKLEGAVFKEAVNL
ncbi:MAG: Atg14 domain-containing protein [Caldimicrobium sp.]|nr:Atg14 domain-containing protein [Caldimicrobium sp.]